MNIGIIGTGNVGGTLGTAWGKKGHRITFGARNPSADDLPKLLQHAGSGARAVPVREVLRGNDVIVLAVPWEAARDAIHQAGEWTGKILIDATNPIALGMEGLSRGLVIGDTTSAGEQVAGWARGASVVKALNTTGAGNMANPVYGSQSATMFVAGDDARAKETASRLVQDLGFEVVDVGPLTAARLLEPLAMLWIHLAFMQGLGPNFAFQLMRR